MSNIVESFYAAFADLNPEGMLACYHEEITFEDPAFGKLSGDRARAMWQMLCESQRGKDFRIEYKDVQLHGNTGQANWEAWYTFNRTKRKVHNRILAQFVLQDGKIIQHTDRFDLYRWARQAMGLSGWLIGWTPFFKKKLQQQTNRLLDKFMEASAH